MTTETEVFEYKIYCNTEQQLITYYGTTPPTTCPRDSSHVVNPSVAPGISITNRPITVVDGSPIYGYFQASTITITIPPPMTVPATIITDVTYPFDVYLWEMSICQDRSNIGDSLSVQLGPDTVIGVILQNALAGSTIIHCSPTVFQAVARGCEIGLWDGGVTKEYPGRIIAIDVGAGTITVEKPLVNTYGVGSPILFSVYPVRNLICDSDQRIGIGNKGLKPKLFAAGTLVRLIYIDNTPNMVTTHAYFQIQYYHV